MEYLFLKNKPFWVIHGFSGSFLKDSNMEKEEHCCDFMICPFYETLHLLNIISFKNNYLLVVCFVSKFSYLILLKLPIDLNITVIAS